MKISRKQIFLLIFLALLVILTNFATEILAPDAEAWLRETIGENYKRTLLFLLLGGTLATLLLTDWKKWLKPSVATSEEAAALPDKEINEKIKAYLKSRYEHRIRQKLAGREPVNLRKIPSSTGTSGEGAQNFITLPAEKVPSGMAELFDEARGRLLVVGAPGAGKTTLLLQLALALLERPGKDLPVLLNLATWRSEFATFDEWLQRILPLELGASKALAEKIRRNTPLILLLDGLDEVPEDARASCLRAIGEYGAEANRRFVISSRIAEYAATQDAPVYLEVEVRPLTPQQVMDNLTAYVFHQPEAKPLLNALQTDSLLREAVANPFYLNTAQLLFATGRKYSDFGFTATDVVGRHRELVERFVEDALRQKVKQEYLKEKARKWLGFLARKMEEDGKVRFELVDVRPNWVANKWDILMVYGWIVGILICAILILPFYFNWGVFILLINIFAILSAFLLRNRELPLETEDLLSWSWAKFNKDWKSKTLPTVYIGLALGAISSASQGLKGLFTGLLFAFNIGLLARFYESGTLVEKLLQVNRPYQRFYNSLKNEILRFAIVFWPMSTVLNLTQINIFLIGFVISSVIGSTLFRHIAIRIMLCFYDNTLPLRLVTFLNEMSLRHLLEFDGDPMTGKSGGSWRWRHRIIQEYFLEK